MEKFLILGLGKSGEAAAHLLHKQGAKAVIWDNSENELLFARAAALEKLGIEVCLSKRPPTSNHFSQAVVSPGIADNCPMMQWVLDSHLPIIGEIELAFLAWKKPIVAITGTNGKTTTTLLTAHLVSHSGPTAIACGNVGLPFSQVVLDNNCDIAIVEVSSFQLETIRQFRPNIAVWTNFSPNHLDRYPSVEAYRKAKLRIFENQTATDLAIIRSGEQLAPIAKTVTFSATTSAAHLTLQNGQICLEGKPILSQEQTRLQGPHNAENIMAALAVVHGLDLPLEAAAKAATTFEPVEHRCEWVANVNGVEVINDSKSTNLDALEKAIHSQTRPIVLIAGGKDKGSSFAPIAALVRERVKSAVLIGQMRNRIASDWSAIPCQTASSLPDAVNLAIKQAQPGDTILFSPGTSSFDMFSGYEERGRVFKEAVRNADCKLQIAD